MSQLPALRIAVVVTAVVAVLVWVAFSLWPERDAAPAGSTPRPPDAQPMLVLQVLDGGSLMLASELPGPHVHERGTITARLLSVDAPHLGIVPECYSAEAKDRLEELLPPGSIAWVATDEQPQDAAGRWLFDVWAPDGRYVNYLLAVDGFVRAEEMPPNQRLYTTVQRAASSAAARFGGLWGQCR